MALVTVSRVEPLCPGMLRVTLTGPEIGEMEDGGAAAGAKIFFPCRGAPMRSSRFSGRTAPSERCR